MQVHGFEDIEGEVAKSFQSVNYDIKKKYRIRLEAILLCDVEMYF